ncbi:MAG TPA: HPr(Ser) kinase/phosphatase [Polyangiaceae bacterium]|nr:HPr(Ser) kinase/phosphatase [Polyangiaceae bacterium]
MPDETGRPGNTSATIPELTVRELVEDPHLSLALRRLAGESGLGRPLRHPRVQKNGLALAGHFHGVVPTRVQVLGETELSYLDSLDSETRSVAARGFFSLGLSCVVVTGGHEPSRALVAAAEATGTPFFVASARSSRTINALHAVLDDRLAPQTQLHGVLVDVHGIGILLTGKSGIGKSECALELVMRGHRLIADDVVRCDWRPPGTIHGRPADLLRHHIEIRGLGVIDIRELFGITAVGERKQIDLVVRLCEWNDREEFDRLGVEERYHAILGTPLRELRVPVRPGRDMGSIIELAARNELLRRDGRHSAHEFLDRIESHLVTRPAIEREPESLVAPAVADAPPAQRQTWSSLPPQASGTESSAWVPAVRPAQKDKDE